MSKQTGKVKWFNAQRGFGFIGHKNEDVFVHHTEIKRDGYRTLMEGEIVDYDLIHTDRGLQAKNVNPKFKPNAK